MDEQIEKTLQQARQTIETLLALTRPGGAWEKNGYRKDIAGGCRWLTRALDHAVVYQVRVDREPKPCKADEPPPAERLDIEARKTKARECKEKAYLLRPRTHSGSRQVRPSSDEGS